MTDITMTITITNGAGYEIYKQAVVIRPDEDEREVLIDWLKDNRICLCDGDTIKIETY